VRLSHKSETVAHFLRQSHFCETVSLFCDSVDRALVNVGAYERSTDFISLWRRQLVMQTKSCFRIVEMLFRSRNICDWGQSCLKK